MFNVGGEGQFVAGAFAAAWAGITFTGLPAYIHLPLALLTGALVGALVGFIPGILKARLGAHEVISTIMLNYVIANLTDYLVLYPFAEGGSMPETKLVAETARLGHLFPNSQLSSAFFLALLTAIVIHFLLWKTVIGFEVRGVGLNPVASLRKGIKVKNIMTLAMVISGAIAGLGGAGETLGTYGRFMMGFSPGYGFDGIAVALVAGLNPLGVIPAAFMFGVLRVGGTYMQQFANIPSALVTIIQGLMILFIIAPRLTTLVMSIFRHKPKIIGRRDDYATHPLGSVGLDAADGQSSEGYRVE